jgi:hypothetical protein
VHEDPQKSGEGQLGEIKSATVPASLSRSGKAWLWLTYVVPMSAYATVVLFAPADILAKHPWAKQWADAARQTLMALSKNIDIYKHAQTTAFPQVAILSSALAIYLVIFIALTLCVRGMYTRRYRAALEKLNKVRFKDKLGTLLIFPPLGIFCMWAFFCLGGDPSFAIGYTTQGRGGYLLISTIAILICGTSVGLWPIQMLDLASYIFRGAIMSNSAYISAVFEAWSRPDAWDAGGAVFTGAEQAFKEFGLLVQKTRAGTLSLAEAARMDQVAKYFAAAMGKVSAAVSSINVSAVTPDELKLKAFITTLAQQGHVSWPARPTGVSRESLCKVAMALVLMFPGWAHAQPVELQIRTATNDKIQRNMTPFAIALGEVLGEAFVEKHKPIYERRRPCQWLGKWEECSYLALRRNDVTEGEIQAIQNVMRNPCSHVTVDQQVRVSPQESTAERRLTRRASSIDKFCRSGFFRTAGVRQAERSVFSSKKEQQLQQAGALEFEALVLGVSN